MQGPDVLLFPDFIDSHVTFPHQRKQSGCTRHWCRPVRVILCQCPRQSWNQCPDSRYTVRIETMSDGVENRRLTLLAHRPEQVTAGQADGIQPRTMEILQVS